MSNKPQTIRGYHWLLFFICFFGTVFAGMISTLMPVYLPVAVRELLGNRSEEEINRIGAYINAIFLFGGAFGGFTCGLISDRAGRKKAVIISILSYSIFTILTSLMAEWWGVVICRFMSGVGLGGILVTTTTLMMEEWPEKTRSIFIGILSIAIPVGIFSAGVIDIFVSSWRQAFAVGYLPLVLAIAAMFLLRESKQWLAHRNRVQTRTDAVNPPIGQYRGSLFIGSVIFGTMLIGLWAIFLWLPTWIQTLITNGDGQAERGMSMMMLGAGGLVGGFLSGWLMNAIGTRRSLILCFAVCAIGAFVLFKTNSAFSLLIYAEILIIALFFGASQGVLSVYIPNLFPVSIRGTATGFCFNTGRIVTATAVLFVGLLVALLGGYGNALFVFSFVFLIGLAVTWFTKISVVDHREGA
jgi:MFS family permease